MTQITIQNLDDSTKALFDAYTRGRGISIKEHARIVIQQAVETKKSETDFGSQILQCFSSGQLEKQLGLNPHVNICKN